MANIHHPLTTTNLDPHHNSNEQKTDKDGASTSLIYSRTSETKDMHDNFVFQLARLATQCQLYTNERRHSRTQCQSCCGYTRVSQAPPMRDQKTKQIKILLSMNLAVWNKRVFGKYFAPTSMTLKLPGSDGFCLIWFLRFGIWSALLFFAASESEFGVFSDIIIFQTGSTTQRDFGISHILLVWLCVFNLFGFVHN